ncbi:MAG: PIG-L deacetylase family protein [Luteolibacter sp.]
MERSIINEGFPLQARAAVVVAHPDDEILWCGGLILAHPQWHWHIVTLCRADDPDRAPKFNKVLEALHAEGRMGGLDDEPAQDPLAPSSVGETVLRLLPDKPFDLIVTHGPRGEYTRHRRHEECCRAVARLWEEGRIRTQQLWFFAYDDGGRAFLPRASIGAHHQIDLPDHEWREKHRLITDVYGFQPDSWEARTTPRHEGFWCFRSPQSAMDFIQSNPPPP